MNRKKSREAGDDEGGRADDPEDLGREMGAEEGDRGDLVAAEEGQGADRFAPGEEGRLADDDGQADRRDDHLEDAAARDPPEEDPLDGDARTGRSRPPPPPPRAPRGIAGRRRAEAIMPPSIANSPWAKLMMPVAL